MPSRQRKQPENRRRTGCFQCKEKHVQCTEEKPSCKRCERLGLQCERGIKLTFREDAIERGIHFGREGTWSKRCNRIRKPPVLELDEGFVGVPIDQWVKRWIWLNTTYNDFTGEADSLEDDDGKNEFEVSQDNTDQIRWALSHDRNTAILNQTLHMRSLGNPFGSYTDAETHLLSYFVSGIGPNCSLSSSHNPYLSLIPLFSHSTLRNTILAVSANQLSLLGDKKYSSEACMYKQRALTSLKEIVEPGTVDFPTVASVLMLCFHDISDGSSSSWLTHLRGGLNMIKYLPETSAQMEFLKRFYNMYFVSHEIMSRTARIECDDEWDESAPELQWLETDDLDEIDSIVGCSRRLMSLLDQTTTLARQKLVISRKNPSDIDGEFIKKCEDIMTALEGLQQRLPVNYSPTDNTIVQIAEIKRLTALLSFMEHFGDIVSPSSSSSSYHSSSTPINSSAYSSLSFSSTTSTTTPSSSFTSTTPSYSTSFKQLTKQRLVSNIIDLISTLPNPNTAFVIWPLYTIGHSSGLEDETQRRFILERLRDIQQTRNLGNVRRARKAVERAFRAIDLDFLPASSQSPILTKRRGSNLEIVISLA